MIRVLLALISHASGLLVNCRHAAVRSHLLNTVMLYRQANSASGLRVGSSMTSASIDAPGVLIMTSRSALAGRTLAYHDEPNHSAFSM
jgi:hypothetical protein